MSRVAKIRTENRKTVSKTGKWRVIITQKEVELAELLLERFTNRFNSKTTKSKQRLANLRKISEDLSKSTD